MLAGYGMVPSEHNLRNAKHQVPLPDEEELTAFETQSKLYQFQIIPFGVINRVARIQQTI